MKSLSHARLLVTPWTAAYQAPPSMGFSRQEYWSGVPLPSLDKRNSICKSHKDEELGQGMGLESHEENGTRGQRNGQCQMVETRDGHLRNGKPLKDSKQKSDRPSFTRPVISPGPLYLCFLIFGAPHIVGESQGARVTIPILSQAVQLPLIVLLQSHCQPSIAFPLRPTPFLMLKLPTSLPSFFLFADKILIMNISSGFKRVTQYKSLGRQRAER